MIDVSDIHMIQVISEVGSINKAAELLHVSQPTLSKKVSRLEKKIDMELFDRDISGMVPTEAAKFLVMQSDTLKNHLHVIERQLELMANKIGGVVRVGVGPIIEQLILPNVLLDFAEQNYEFKVVVSVLPAEELLNRLGSGHIDIAIGPFAQQDASSAFVSPLHSAQKLVVAVRPGHSISTKGTVSFDDLLSNKLVAPDVPKSMGRDIQTLMAGSALEPDITCESYAMAKLVVQNSDYITAGPEALFQKEFEEGKLIKLTFAADVTWQCKCLVKPQTLLSPRVKEIVSIFGQYMSGEGDN
ncbi:LysR family transcriptional regulator [Alteromonas macleodii]